MFELNETTRKYLYPADESEDSYSDVVAAIKAKIQMRRLLSPEERAARASSTAETSSDSDDIWDSDVPQKVKPAPKAKGKSRVANAQVNEEILSPEEKELFNKIRNRGHRTVCI